MPLHWLPPRRYVIPARPLATARGAQGACTGTLFACTDGTLTGWGDCPDAATQRGHSDAAARFAEDCAQLHLQAQQHGMTLAAWLHAEFPQWTVPPRGEVALQGLVEFADLAADPQQAELRALGLTCLKVKLLGTEAADALRQTIAAAAQHGWQLRLDVNGGWQDREDLTALFAACQAPAVQYIEDPLPLERAPFDAPVAVALDAIDSSADAVMAAARAGHCQTAVVKPALWGSVARVLADAAELRTRGIGVVLSSCMEGPIGLSHLAQFAAVLPAPLPAGLATHLLWPEAWQPTSLHIHAGRWTLPPFAPHHADPVAVIDAGLGRPVALADQVARAHALASHLQARGVQPGTVVATWSGNAPEALVAWQAVRLCGATWLPLHPRLTGAEVATLLTRVPPALLLTDAAHEAEAASMPYPQLALATIADLPAATVLPVALAPDATAALLFTSGSSGPAKAVQLSCRALAAAADAAIEQFGPQYGGAWLCCLPVCHVSGLLVLERASRLGMAVLLADQPSTAELGALFTALQPRLASLVPAQLTRLLDAQAAPPRELLAVLIGGAPCPAELVDRARAAGWPVLPTYGMTETAAQVATAPVAVRLDRTPWPRADDAVCVGPAVPGVALRVVDGVIEVQSRQLLSGYLHAPTPVHDGWLHTGDLGYLDARGWLWVRGRRGELILRGGENVTPDEVEAVLAAIPGVHEVCVVGLADAVLGQRVAAWLTVTTPLDMSVLEVHLQNLARFKRPDIWLQTTEPLPRTGPGKVARGQVRQRLQLQGRP